MDATLDKTDWKGPPEIEAAYQGLSDTGKSAGNFGDGIPAKPRKPGLSGHCKVVNPHQNYV